MPGASPAPPPEGDDLHVLVLQSAFRLMSYSTSQVTITARGGQKVSLPRDVLVLFSPKVRALLNLLPCSNTQPVLSLPDVTAASLLTLQDILTQGHCQAPLTLPQTAELLEACNLLGLDISSLHVGLQQERKEVPVNEVTVNLDGLSNREEDIKAIIQQRRKEGSQIILTKTFKKKSLHRPNSKHQPDSVPVKKEKVVPTEEVQDKENDEDSMETDNTPPPSSTSTSLPPPTIKPPPPSPVQVNKREKFACEKCKKVQETALLLKYHYCSHYMDILRKKFDHHEESKKNICFICKKAHPNSRRLLLHIGVNHDKINDILKLKGFKQIPSALTEKTSETKKEPSKGAEGDKKSFDIRSMMDLKPTPTPGPSVTPTPAPTVTSSPGPSVSPAPGPSVSSGRTGDKSSLDSECNFDLKCQVCQQKLSSLHMLEQHICRHFMKELAEQFADITTDMKCGLCHLTFKQRHSLLLHIGCKHGKINDILKQKGYVVLPAPVVNSSNGALQKQMQNRLLEIKKERHTETDDVLKKEEDSTSEEQTSKQGETPLPYAFKLSEVLNKFSVPSI